MSLKEIGKKLGLPAYSSKQAHVEIEVELAEERLQQPEKLLSDLERLFAVASQSVDEQLRLSGLPAPLQSEQSAKAEQKALVMALDSSKPNW